MHVQPTHAFGLSLGEAAAYFAFDEANSKQSDAVLARLTLTPNPNPNPNPNSKQSDAVLAHRASSHPPSP